MHQMTVIGIDFGTEFSSAAAKLEDGHIHILPDDHGKIKISSCVSFLYDEIRIGTLAELKRETNPKNTIFDMKMLLGQRFEAATKLKKKYDWPFDITEDSAGKAQVKVQYHRSTHHFYPEEIVAIFFHHLVQIAEKRLQPIKVSGAVITVSSEFNHSQRKSIIDAAHIAKLEVKSLLNETSAAAIHYSVISPKRHNSHYVMVIHVGSGSFGVSAYEVGSSKVSVRHSHGESFGGKDINMQIFRDVIQSRGSFSNFPTNNYWNFYKTIERVKMDFQHPNKKKSSVELHSEFGDLKKLIVIQRREFDDACHALRTNLRTAMTQIRSRVQISEVLLVGGSTRLSLVHEILNELRLNSSPGIKTDEAIVLGAAMLACRNFHEECIQKHPLCIEEELPYSIVDQDKKCYAHKYSWRYGHATQRPIDEQFTPPTHGCVFQLLDQYENKMIYSKKKLYMKFRFTLEIDPNGLISMSGQELPEVINGLSEEKILELIARQSQLIGDNVKTEIANEAMYNLEKDVFNAKKTANKLLEACRIFEDWIDQYPNCEIDTLRSKREELHAILDSIRMEDGSLQYKPDDLRNEVKELRKTEEQLENENLRLRKRIEKLESGQSSQISTGGRKGTSASQGHGRGRKEAVHKPTMTNSKKEKLSNVKWGTQASAWGRAPILPTVRR